MAQAVLFSLPDNAIVGDADAARSLGANDRQDIGLRAAYAKIKAAHPAADRRTQDLIDHDLSRAAHVLDREDRAVRKEADREPRSDCRSG